MVDHEAWDKTRWDKPDQDNIHELRPLVATPAPLPDPTSIPPRAWLYGTTLVRRYVSVLVAPGGVGKTSFAIGLALSLASGKSLFGDKVFQRCRVWLWNGDDPSDELDRRIAAMMIRHDIKREDLDGWFFRDSGRERRLTMVLVQEDGTEITFPDKKAILAEINRLHIDVIIVDPFVKAHSLNENSNQHMDAAATAWAEVAQETDSAVQVVHHTRKGVVIDVDAARGAKALTDAGRVTQILSAMSKDEAQALNVRDEERWHYFRWDDVKVNLAPRAARARWFRLDSVSLGNRTERYPAGDHVGAVVSWEPPSPWEDMPGDLVIAILDAIERGPAPGLRYHETRRGNEKRWAGSVVMEMADKDEHAAMRIVRAWRHNDVLQPDEYYDSDAHKDRKGLKVNPDKLIEMRRQWFVQQRDAGADLGLV